LCITGALRFGVERLQLTHGFQAYRRGCVIQTERIRGEVHRDQTESRMTGGHFGHQPREQRRQKTSEAFNESSFFCNLQKAQPQCERAEQ
jgi:hypothetical protein